MAVATLAAAAVPVTARSCPTAPMPEYSSATARLCDTLSLPGMLTVTLKPAPSVLVTGAENTCALSNHADWSMMASAFDV